MQSIKQFIKHNQLRPGDAVELICPVAGFPKHYTVYMGTKNGNPQFIANMMEGVQLVRDQELLGFLVKYQVTNIERFAGSEVQRRKVVRRALARLGEKAYCFVFNNCEHFKNWVLYGESKSHQVDNISSAIASGGLLLIISGVIFDKKGLQKAGITVLIVLFIAFIMAWMILRNKTDQ